MPVAENIPQYPPLSDGMMTSSRQGTPKYDMSGTLLRLFRKMTIYSSTS
jgi:hypothetical protein